MDPLKPSVSTTQFEKNLDELEHAHRKGAQVTYRMRRDTGEVEVKVAKHWSPFRWLANKFGHKQAKSQLTQEIKQALHNTDAPKRLQERVIRDLGSKTIPFLSSATAISSLSHQREFKHLSDTAELRQLASSLKNQEPAGISKADASRFLKLCQKAELLDPLSLQAMNLEKVIGKVQKVFGGQSSESYQEAITKALVEELESLQKTQGAGTVSYLLSRVVEKASPGKASSEMESLTVKGMELSGSEISRLKKEPPALRLQLLQAKYQLKAEELALREKMPNIGIADTWGFLEKYCFLTLLSGIPDYNANSLESEIQKQFRDTRQQGLYDRTINFASVRAVQDLTDTFPRGRAKNIISEAMSNSPSPEFRVASAALETIKGNLSREYSVTGDRPDQVKDNEIELLPFFGSKEANTLLKSQLYELKSATKLFEQRTDIKALEPYLKKLDLPVLQNQLKALEKPDALPPEARIQAQDAAKKVIQAKKLWLDLNAGVGRKWGQDVLQNPLCTSSEFSTKIRKLEQLAALTSPALDLEQLSWMQQQNLQAKAHPRAVVEGAGPNGLMAALKLYMEGADVTVFEKRGTDYNRSQILRLDSQWMNDLRFVLGSKFDDLFDPKTGMGTKSTDGSGSIVTHELEKVLHRRFSELVSKEEKSRADSPRLKRLAAHSIDDVLPPVKDGGPYRIKAVYENRYDSQKSGPGSAKGTEIVEADLLVCAGGKNSPTRDMFFTHAPVTDEAEYGVASWNNINNDGMKTFPAIQGVLQFDGDFRANLITNLQQRTDYSGGLSEKAEKLAIKYTSLGNNSPLSKMMLETKDKVVQLRTFENRGMIYVGMEIPHGTKRWLESLDQAAQTEGLSDGERKEVVAAAKQSWFQAVADVKGITAQTGTTMDKMSSKFTATFPVAQSALAQSFQVIPGTKSNPKDGSLLVVPIGDAATSPHFMSASGLTGGRESQNILVEYLKNFQQTPEKQSAHLEAMQERFDNSKKYVLDKGKAYLTPLQPLKVRQGLRMQQRRQLDQVSKDSTQPGWKKNYTLKATGNLPSNTSYQLSTSETPPRQYMLHLQEKGNLEVWRIDGHRNQLAGTFNSFKEAELKLLRTKA
ncbi:hypothetical protein EOPP23_09420 [Endozoicomonas sp. OPT23]|uniref:FAD-dependent monooxygenase n=1 Tax=Endozoicomonas sp. OPT23 TaxID=2072845 RepID=UPI00129BFAF9|nr:FAD-dependent monooxygenase [Endozoicomonas sp. OPT23]MRI33202.1 hypothetical protein [Endozoicomonas sp. OPT23]